MNNSRCGIIYSASVICLLTLTAFTGVLTAQTTAQATTATTKTSAPVSAGKLFDSMDDVSLWKPEQQATDIQIRTDKDGHDGAAVEFQAIDNRLILLGFHSIKPDPDWNNYDGLAFWVKGDGSDNWGCVRLKAGKYDRAWVGTFPLKDRTWHQVRMAWNDLVPTAMYIPELGAEDDFRPGNINYIAFGKSWSYNPDRASPAITFSIDQVELIKGVKADRPRVTLDKFPSLDPVIKKLKSGQPVTILALGDSITWGEIIGKKSAYPVLLGKMLADYYHNDKITVVNKAIVGSTTSYGREWLRRDLTGLQADMVLVMIGFNERPAPNEKPNPDAFAANLVRYLEESAGVMKDAPSCLVLTTIPGRDKQWDNLDTYAQAVRDLAVKYKNVRLVDPAAVFKAMGKESYGKLLKDEAHPGVQGHIEMAKIVFKAITGEDAKEDRLHPTIISGVFRYTSFRY